MKEWFGLTTGRACSDDQIYSTIDDFTPVFEMDANVVLQQLRS